MKVYAYWDNVERREYPTELIDRWADSFSKRGFKPQILGVADARRHPDYDKIRRMVKKFPTVNQASFEEPCWLRWLAFQLVAPALFADYDVINYSARPSDIPTVVPVAYLGANTIYATADAIAKFIAFWPNARPQNLKGKLHIADWIAFYQFMTETKIESIRTKMCVEYGRLGYESAQMVHFSNAWVPKQFAFQNRYKIVDQYTAKRFSK